MRRLERERPRDVGLPRALRASRAGRRSGRARDCRSRPRARASTARPMATRRACDASTRARASSNDCEPSESRFTPASRQARTDSRVMSSGFASSVTLGVAAESDAAAQNVEQRERRRRRRVAMAFRRRSRACRSSTTGLPRGRKRSASSRSSAVDVLLDRHRAAYRDGEIAVRAAARAERNVDVDVARAHGRMHIEICRSLRTPWSSATTNLSGERALDGAAQLETGHRGQTLVHRKRGARTEIVERRRGGSSAAQIRISASIVEVRARLIRGGVSPASVSASSIDDDRVRAVAQQLDSSRRSAASRSVPGRPRSRDPARAHARRCGARRS